MTRRWLISCGSLAISTTLVAVAWSQSPSLSERFQQLRNGWSDPATSTPAPAPEGTAQTPAPPTERRSMLPKVDPRSLLPDNLFGRSTPTSTPTPTPAAEPTQELASPRRSPSTQSNTKPGAVAGSRMGSQQRAGSQPTPQPSTNTVMLPATRPSPAKTSTSPTLPPITPVPAESPKTATTAPVRRSPPHRTPPNFDSEALRSELSNSFATSEPTPEPTTASSEPTPADDFAAGLEKEAASLGRSATPKRSPTASAEPTAESSRPIRLQPSNASPRTAKSGSAGENRYGESNFPSVGGLIGRKTESEPIKPESDSAPAEDSSVVVSDEAAKAFRFDTKPYPTTKQAEPQPPRESPRYATSPRASETPRESFTEPHSNEPIETELLMNNEAPAISSNIRGPQQITIGREATYELRLNNTGNCAAQDLIATIRIPSWADVVSTTTSHGLVRQGEGSDPSSALQWEIPRLESNADELLTLKLIPRASRPLELGVTWAHAPVDARTIVEVQEPKLQMSVSGPDEVLYGKPHVYRLTIANPGTGTAESVKIDLMPPGGGRESVSTHPLGNLKPGESKSVEIELTAREAGKLNVQALASADGGLTSEAVKELFCRKPELEVDWRGPETQYAGTPATYFFRVRNPGTAPAEDVVVKVALPTGAEFVSASEGYREDAKASEVAWRVGSLGPGDDCYMELRCVVHTPGENELRVAAATTSGDLADNKMATTKVVALADLKLDVCDPAGPVPVGEESIYEIRVTNRGANAAEDVNVVGLFSAGLEPETVEGSAYTATDGRVSFRTIRKLPPGQNVVLQIRAKATQPGTHVFRAEVLCRDLEIKLAAEETTRFYANQSLNDSKSSPTMIGSRESSTSRH